MAYGNNKTVIVTVRMSNDESKQLELVKNKFNDTIQRLHNNWWVHAETNSKAIRIMTAIFF